MVNENDFKISGVIFSIKNIVLNGRKDSTKTYNKLELTLDVKSKRYINYVDKKTKEPKSFYASCEDLIKFEAFEPRFDTSLFYKEDIVEISFYIHGKESEDGSKKIFNKNVIKEIKHTDMQRGDGKVKVTAMSDIDTIGKPPEDNPFPEVKTNMNPLKIDIEEDDSDFPF